MNKRFFIHKITIYHIGEIVTKSQFKSAYFRHNKKSNLIDKGFDKGSVGTIIIPTSESLNINTNDYVVEGIVTDDFNLPLLMKNHQVFKVVSVDDNRKGGLPHYKIGVSE